MKELDLADAVRSKDRDPEASTLLGAKLTWGQSYALFSLVMCGKDSPMERFRDDAMRNRIMRSAQPYALNSDQLDMIIEAEPQPRMAYLHGLTKAAHQKLRYGLFGTVGNHFNANVFMKSGSHPADAVRLHLGLKDLIPERSFMDMWVSSFLSVGHGV